MNQRTRQKLFNGNKAAYEVISQFDGPNDTDMTMVMVKKDYSIIIVQEYKNGKEFSLFEKTKQNEMRALDTTIMSDSESFQPTLHVIQQQNIPLPTNSGCQNPYK